MTGVLLKRAPGFLGMASRRSRAFMGTMTLTGQKRPQTFYRYFLDHVDQNRKNQSDRKGREIMVLLDRIELSTSPLPRDQSACIPYENQ